MFSNWIKLTHGTPHVHKRVLHSVITVSVEVQTYIIPRAVPMDGSRLSVPYLYCRCPSTSRLKKTLCWQQNEIVFISTMIYFEWRFVDEPWRSKWNELSSSISCELQDRVLIRVVTFTAWWVWGWWIFFSIPWFLHQNVMAICLFGQPIPCSSLFLFNIALPGLYGCCPGSDVLFCWSDKTNGWANTHWCAALPEGMIHHKCMR